MRFKFYLRGCGLGILFTAIVLMIGFHRAGKSEMTDEEIMRRAAELGMVKEDADRTDATGKPEEADAPEETENPKEADAPESGTEPGSRQTEPQTLPESGTEPQTPPAGLPESEGAEDEGGSSNPPPESVENPDGSVILVVKDGDVCRDIAAELYRTKIVSDAEEFRKFMGQNGYSSEIRNGTYTFMRGMEYQEIAEILTKKR